MSEILRFAQDDSVRVVGWDEEMSDCALAIFAALGLRRPTLHNSYRRVMAKASEFDDELAYVGAGKKHVDGFGGFLEAFDNDLPVFDLTHHFPHAELLAGIHKSGSIVEDDETLDAETLDQDTAEAGEGWILVSVARDESAENDATVEVHAVENGFHDFAADVFKVDIDTVGSGSSKLFLPLGVLVVDGGVEAEVVFNPFTFFVGTSDADDAAAVNLANLAGDAAGGTGGGGDDQGFTGLRLADLEQAEVGGETIDAESAEEVGVREEGNGRKLLK